VHHPHVVHPEALRSCRHGPEASIFAPSSARRSSVVAVAAAAVTRCTAGNSPWTGGFKAPPRQLLAITREEWAVLAARAAADANDVIFQLAIPLHELHYGERALGRHGRNRSAAATAGDSHPPDGRGSGGDADAFLVRHSGRRVAPRKATNPQRAGVDADTAACKPRLREIVGIYLCRRGRSTCN
jgi:hypothetical protein